MTAKDPKEALNVTVRIMGKEYTVACPQEEHEALVKSADYLNERMTTIRKRGKALGGEKIAVMAALNIARELLEMRGVEGVAATDHRAPASCAKCQDAAARPGTRAAVFSACADAAVPSTIRFLMPWTMPVSRNRL